MLIRVRRGLEANRLSYTPQAGEPTYTTDTKKLYIGDGVTPGGILVDLSGSGVVQTIVAGENITVDATDPSNPIVSATPGGGGAVDSVNGQTGEVVLDADDIDDTSTTNKFATAAEKTKLGHIAVTQAVDLDAMETKLATIETNADVTDAANVGAVLHGASAKATPVDADTVSLIDSAASNALKKLSWANIKATLKSYFDTFYQPVATVLTNTTASFTTTLKDKLDGIEAGADVTDAANVDAAGALMESELLFPDDVKAFEAADFATSDQGLLADTAVQPVELGAAAFSNDYGDLDNLPTIPTSVDDLSPSQATHSGKFLKTDGVNASWETIPGGGDMLASVYDPTSVVGDAFDMDNMAEGADTKIMTAAERTKLGHISVTQAVDLDTIESNLASHIANTSNPHSVTKSQVGLSNVDNTSDATKQAATLLAAFPVGSIYITTNSTNPGTWLGGTWAAFGAGRVPVGFDSGQTEFDTDEETGGEKTHTLTTDEMPTHTHSPSNGTLYRGGNSATSGRVSNADSAGTGVVTNGSWNVGDAGGGQAHNNLQPYIVVRMWKRTA